MVSTATNGHQLDKGSGCIIGSHYSAQCTELHHGPVEDWCRFVIGPAFLLHMFCYICSTIPTESNYHSLGKALHCMIGTLPFVLCSPPHHWPGEGWCRIVIFSLFHCHKKPSIRSRHPMTSALLEFDTETRCTTVRLGCFPHTPSRQMPPVDWYRFSIDFLFHLHRAPCRR